MSLFLTSFVLVSDFSFSSLSLSFFYCFAFGLSSCLLFALSLHLSKIFFSVFVSVCFCLTYGAVDSVFDLGLCQFVCVRMARGICSVALIKHPCLSLTEIKIKTKIKTETETKTKRNMLFQIMRNHTANLGSNSIVFAHRCLCPRQRTHLRLTKACVNRNKPQKL